ncbi:MAG: hypothetical protein H6850_01970 [Alphaproteobacteria bacterium]|nr:MAG: hypothetical protein H6850_01970 [Alphaproteobacteria bacterium]
MFLFVGYLGANYFRKPPTLEALMKPYPHIQLVDNTLTACDDREIYECLEKIYPYLQEFEIYKHKGLVKAKVQLK